MEIYIWIKVVAEQPFHVQAASMFGRIREFLQGESPRFHFDTCRALETTVASGFEPVQQF
jgi:hypothetical protein